MARGTPGARPGRGGARARGRRTQRPSAPSRTPRTARPSPSAQPAPTPPAGPFRLGAVEGATPGRWIGTWEQRMPHTALELIPLSVATQRDAIVTGAVDIALVRQPIDREGLQLIPLYDEVPVVVMAADATLSAADELDAADLAGEVLIGSREDVLGYTTPGTRPPAFEMPETTADAVATVAAGVGIAVMPMSLARLHHRKDVTYRVLRGGPVSSIALAWDADRTTPLVDTFVGIVRGRTANSSR